MLIDGAAGTGPVLSPSRAHTCPPPSASLRAGLTHTVACARPSSRPPGAPVRTPTRCPRSPVLSRARSRSGRPRASYRSGRPRARYRCGHPRRVYPVRRSIAAASVGVSTAKGGRSRWAMRSCRLLWWGKNTHIACGGEGGLGSEGLSSLGECGTRRLRLKQRRQKKKT